MNVTAEEMETLVLENQGLIYWCLKPYKDFKTPRYDYEDLVQVAHEGFMKAIKDYDESKGKISTYMAFHIPNYLSRFVKKNMSQFTVSTKTDYKAHIPEVSSLNFRTAADGLELEGLVGKPDDKIELITLLDSIEQICHTFTLDGNELFNQWKMWRFGGYTQREIADFYGLERGAVAMRLKNIEKKLKLMGDDNGHS